MSRIAGPYHIYRRPYQTVSAYHLSNIRLTYGVCAKWVSRSFANLPAELAQYREPRTKAAVQTGATLLTDYLKRQLSPAINSSGLLNAVRISFLLIVTKAAPFALPLTSIKRSGKPSGSRISVDISDSTS